MIIAGLWVLAMVLHNAIYAVFYSGTAGDEPFFFLLATVVIPLYAMVSLVYTAIEVLRKQAS